MPEAVEALAFLLDQFQHLLIAHTFAERGCEDNERGWINLKLGCNCFKTINCDAGTGVFDVVQMTRLATVVRQVDRSILKQEPWLPWLG